MFVGVNFLVMFNFFGHIHWVILNRSSDYSSKIGQIYVFTRLHGWKYLDSEESNFSKCFWIFIIFVALVAAAFLLYTNTDEFSNVSVVTR